MGAIKIHWNFYLKSFNRLSKPNRLLLSFDDGPHEVYTLKILELLDKYNIKAFFFVIGKNAENQAEILKKTVSKGHIIGNHSYSHSNYFDFFSTKKMEEDVKETNHILEKIIGYEPKYFRPPFGITNPRIKKMIKITGMKSVGWSFRSFDTTSKTNEEIIKRMKSSIKGGEILLFHDTMERTYDILVEVLPWLTKEYDLQSNLLE